MAGPVVLYGADGYAMAQHYTHRWFDFRRVPADSVPYGTDIARGPFVWTVTRLSALR